MVLETKELSKTFPVGLRGRRVRALFDLTLGVERGEIFGLVGPNGAGKSTTIKLLLGLIRPTRGSGAIDGHPIGSVASRARLGYLPENPVLYDFLRPLEFLRMCGRLHRLDSATLAKRSESLLETVGLTHAVDLSIRKFSKGMVQRLGLAQALIGDPAIVILDEPMSGLDPIGRKDVRDLIFRLREEGRTVFFSTHILPDVEMICDRVALLSKGGLTDVGRLDDLLSHRVLAVEVAVTGLSADSVTRLKRDGAVRSPGEGRVIASFPTLEEANQFLAAALQMGGRVESLNTARENLEELFMRRAAEASESARH
jgi:ABC-2 type transport system ATP-binding protein